MLIQIDGWYAGGKSVLWSLLDGHNDVFVSPIHDYSYQAFLKSSNNDSWIKNKDIIVLRQLLSQKGYHRFEDSYLRKKLYLHLSSYNYLEINYDTNFYEFDKNFISKLTKLKKWSIEAVIELLYSEFYFKHKKNSFIKPKYFASMGHPLSIDHYTNLRKILPNSKRILVKRDLKNIVATRINRCDTDNFINRHTLKDVLQNDEISYIIKYYNEMEILQSENPSQFFTTNLHDLINNTKNEMKKIAAFLDIEFDEILTIPTRDGILLEKNGESFIGKENDVAEDLLSENELELIDLLLKDKLLFNPSLPKHVSIPNTISKIFQKLHNITNNYEKIVIYGNGYLAQTVIPFLGKKLVAVVDQHSDRDNKNYEIIRISDLKKIDYDVIVVTVLGREYEIFTDLLKEEVSPNSIIAL